MLDDDAGTESPAELYAEAIEAASNGELRIEVQRPGRMRETVAAIAELAPQGLLLDVALTNALDDDEQPIGFDGIALAQQVRTLQTRARTPGASDGLPEFPIVRLSKRDVVREYVNKDSTSDDLFDEHVDKEVVLEEPAVAARIVLALATDYPLVIAFADRAPDDGHLASLLGCDPSLVARLDPRVLLGLRRRGAPAHVLARFIVVELLGRAGPLVDAELLAVRLGINAQLSEDWPALLDGLEASRYRGAFDSGYARWWMALSFDWWQRDVDPDRTPQRLSASERVELLKKATGLDRLVAIEPTADSPGLRPWNLCWTSRRPVDPAEGFPLLPVYGMETWHDTEYLCLEEALRRPQDARLSPTERARIAATLRRRKAP